MHQKFKERHRVIKELSKENKFSLDVGGGTMSHGHITIDINLKSNTTIIGDAAFLPVKSNVFERVFFCDVIEHLPIEKEKRALAEINRVFKMEENSYYQPQTNIGFTT